MVRKIAKFQQKNVTEIDNSSNSVKQQLLPTALPNSVIELQG